VARLPVNAWGSSGGLSFRRSIALVEFLSRGLGYRKREVDGPPLPGLPSWFCLMPLDLCVLGRNSVLPAKLWGLCEDQSSCSSYCRIASP
jgi:hypothetical protein